MVALIKSLSEITDRYDVLYCDLWGCLHDGVRPFPAAVAALQEFRNSGGYVMILTNSPRPSPAVHVQLDQIGVPRAAYDDVTSSGDASQAAMVAGLAGRDIYHLGPQRDLVFFTDIAPGLDVGNVSLVPLANAEGIVCTGLIDDQTETPESYRATLLYAKQKGMKLLCTNPDLVVDRGNERVYCAGAIAALYTEMGGESLYFGKPHPPIYDLARNRVVAVRAVTEERILCIGDGIRTDILGGLGDSLDTLFITGGLAAENFGDDPEKPDTNALNDFYLQEQVTPTMAIPFLQ